jgi:hypothetical protein
MAAMTFAERVQALPPELFNTIYEDVFAAPTGVIKIQKDYKPPLKLAMGRDIRELFAKAYYSNNSFEFDCIHWFATWFVSLSKSHRRHLRDITVLHNNITNNEAVHEVMLIRAFIDEMHMLEVDLNGMRFEVGARRRYDGEQRDGCFCNRPPSQQYNRWLEWVQKESKKG